jgi:hypothetical protein
VPESLDLEVTNYTMKINWWFVVIPLLKLTCNIVVLVSLLKLVLNIIIKVSTNFIYVTVALANLFWVKTKCFFIFISYVVAIIGKCS